MMGSGWMVFLWTGAAAGILLVWLVVVAAVVVWIQDRHTTEAPRQPDVPPEESDSERRVPTAVS